MAEEERKPFMSFSFNEEGNFDRYAGIYLHVPLEKPPTPEEIGIMVGTIKSFAKSWQQLSKKLGLAEAQEPAQPRQDGREASPKPQGKDAPRCQATGVWASAKGRYKEGFRRDWRHNDPRENEQGELYCPTPIDKDDDGKLVWCGWRAAKNDDGTWAEVDMNAPEEAEMPFE